MKGELNIFEEAKMLKRRIEIDKFINHSQQRNRVPKSFSTKADTNDRMAFVMGEQLT